MLGLVFGGRIVHSFRARGEINAWLDLYIIAARMSSIDGINVEKTKLYNACRS